MKKINNLIARFKTVQNNLISVRPKDVFTYYSEYPLFIEREYQREICWVSNDPRLIKELYDGIYLSFQEECEKIKSDDYNSLKGYYMHDMTISVLDNETEENIGSNSLIDSSNRMNTIFCFLLGLNLLKYDMDYISREKYICNIENLFFKDDTKKILNINTNFEGMNYRDLFDKLNSYDKEKKKNTIKINYDITLEDLDENVKKGDKIYMTFQRCLDVILESKVYENEEKLDNFYSYMYECIWFDCTTCPQEEKSKRFHDANSHNSPLSIDECIKSALKRYGNSTNGIINKVDELIEKAFQTKYFIQTTNRKNVLTNLFIATLNLEEKYYYIDKLDSTFLSNLNSNNGILGNEEKTWIFLNHMEDIINYLNELDVIDEFNLFFRKMSSAAFDEKIMAKWPFLALYIIDRCSDTEDKRRVAKDYLWRVFSFQQFCGVFGSHKQTEQCNTKKIGEIIIKNIYLPLDEFDNKLNEELINKYNTICIKNKKLARNVIQNNAYQFHSKCEGMNYLTQQTKIIFYIVEYIITRELGISCKHVFQNNIHLDHIIPQSLCKNLNIDSLEYNNIGNLTLLEGDINQEKSGKNDISYYLRSDFMCTNLMNEKSSKKYDFIKVPNDLDSADKIKDFIYKRRIYILNILFNWFYFDKINFTEIDKQIID